MIAIKTQIQLIICTIFIRMRIAQACQLKIHERQNS